EEVGKVLRFGFQRLKNFLLALPRPALFLLGAVVILVVLFVFVVLPVLRRSAPPPPSREGYLFCFWNVENLFDDVNDRRSKIDEKYDNEFADAPELLKLKLDHLSSVILAMNDGKGPDILAVAEIESERALDLLRDRLNNGLGDRAVPYQHM